MKGIHRRTRILARGVREMNSYVGFEGALVGREPDIPLNTKQRTACGSCVSKKAGTQLVQMRREIVDESECGFNHHILISHFVLGEPYAIVVALQLAQKRKRAKAKNGVVRHRELPIDQ